MSPIKMQQATYEQKETPDWVQYGYNPDHESSEAPPADDREWNDIPEQENEDDSRVEHRIDNEAAQPRF